MCLCHSLLWRSPLSQFSIFVCRLLPPPPPPRASWALVCGRLRQLPLGRAGGPLLPAPTAAPPPSRRVPCSPLAEARCAFKESRLLAVTHFWLSARKIAPARQTEKKTNNFSFVCVGLLSTRPPPPSSSQDLNANGGLKPLDPCGFGSLVRPPSPFPPALRLFLPHCFSGVLFKHGGGGAVDSPPSPPFPAPSLKGRERRGRANKHSETGAGSRACQHPGVGAF